MLSDPPGPSLSHRAYEGAKDTREVAPVSRLRLPGLPLQMSRGARQDRGGRFQPKAGLGTGAGDIQVIWGPFLSHAATTGPGEGHGEAGTPGPPCLSQRARPGGPPAFSLPLQGCPSFSGGGGLRPLVLLQTQGRAGPGRASLVLTAKGAMAG